MIKKIQQYFATRTVAAQHKKLEAEFLKMKAEAIAAAEATKLKLEEFGRQLAELPEGLEKVRTAGLLESVRRQHEKSIIDRNARFGRTQMHLDILRNSINF